MYLQVRTPLKQRQLRQKHSEQSLPWDTNKCQNYLPSHAESSLLPGPLLSILSCIWLHTLNFLLPLIPMVPCGRVWHRTTWYREASARPGTPAERGRSIHVRMPFGRLRGRFGTSVTRVEGPLSPLCLSHISWECELSGSLRLLGSIRHAEWKSRRHNPARAAYAYFPRHGSWLNQVRSARRPCVTGSCRVETPALTLSFRNGTTTATLLLGQRT